MAQDILSKSDETVITLRSLVMAELEALGGGEREGAVDVAGPPVRLRNSAVQTLALAVHELATNARKYGALSSNGGRLSIFWQIENPGDAAARLVFTWRETGLALPAGEEERQGYGRYLIERAMPMAFGGATEYSLQPGSLECVFSIPLSQVFKS